MPKWACPFFSIGVPFWLKIDGPGQWSKKTHLNQWNPSMSYQNNLKRTPMFFSFPPIDGFSGPRGHSTTAATKTRAPYLIDSSGPHTDDKAAATRASEFWVIKWQHRDRDGLPSVGHMAMAQKPEFQNGLPW